MQNMFLCSESNSTHTQRALNAADTQRGNFINGGVEDRRRRRRWYNNVHCGDKNNDLLLLHKKQYTYNEDALAANHFPSSQPLRKHHLWAVRSIEHFIHLPNTATMLQLANKNISQDLCMSYIQLQLPLLHWTKTNNNDNSSQFCCILLHLLQ